MGPRLNSRVDAGSFVVTRKGQRASMGPRLNSRGDFLHQACQEQEGEASMGPRLNSRGDRRIMTQETKPDWASMGPRLNSRGDDVYSYDTKEIKAVLQWGRDLIVAETTTGGTCDGDRIAASMGPRLNSRGDSRVRRRIDAAPDRFNGAAT